MERGGGSAAAQRPRGRTRGNNAGAAGSSQRAGPGVVVSTRGHVLWPLPLSVVIKWFWTGL